MNTSEEKELKKHLRKADLKAPFQVTRDDEERLKDKGRVITLRLNEEELAMLQDQKDLLDTDIDGTALKFFWKSGWNVAHRVFGRETLAWVASRDRKRSLRKPHKNYQIVIQNPENPPDPVTHPDKGG